MQACETWPRARLGRLCSGERDSVGNAQLKEAIGCGWQPSALLRAGMAGMTALLADVAPEFASAAGEPGCAAAPAAAGSPAASASASAAKQPKVDPDAAAQTPFIAKLAFLEGLGMRATSAAAMLWRSRELRATRLRRLQAAAAVLLGRAGVLPARLPAIVEKSPQARTDAAARTCKHGKTPAQTACHVSSEIGSQKARSGFECRHLSQ